MKNKIVSWTLWKNGASRAYLIAAAGMLIGVVLIVIAAARPQEGRVITTYTPYDRRLGRWFDLYQIPLAGLIILVLNTYLATKTLNKDRLISHILLAATVFVEFLLLTVSVNFFINIAQ